jgi:uncharacterized membrane protein
MPEIYDHPIDAAPRSSVAPSLITITHLIYGLHTLSLLIGITSSVTIIGAFIFGVPSIIAVILNYIKRSDVSGTYLESHFRWQIRTFWFAALWAVIGMLLWIVLAIVLIGFVIGPLILLGTGIWVIYRIAKGWLILRDRKPIADY